MTLLTLALVVGVLFATGTYLILHRRAIRLILGLGLLTHGVNLLLFSSGGLGRGLPPIILDKKAFEGDITPFVDPLPQALILTAIVISFAVTAFTVVLVNRRHTLAQTIGPDSSELPSIKAPDPFAAMEHYGSGLNAEPDDYEWLEFSLADELRQRRQRAKEKAEIEEAAKAESEQNREVRSQPEPFNDEISQDGDLLSSEAFVRESGNAEETATEQADATDSKASDSKAADSNSADSNPAADDSDKGEQA